MKSWRVGRHYDNHSYMHPDVWEELGCGFLPRFPERHEAIILRYHNVEVGGKIYGAVAVREKH